MFWTIHLIYNLYLDFHPILIFHFSPQKCYSLPINRCLMKIQKPCQNSKISESSENTFKILLNWRAFKHTNLRRSGFSGNPLASGMLFFYIVIP